MHALDPAHRKQATWWLVALVGLTLALAGLAVPAVSHAEESNPNNYECLGSIAPGKPEVGSEEQQVAYVFYCNGPITGYQLQAQIPLTGVQTPPLVTAGASVLGAPTGKPLIFGHVVGCHADGDLFEIRNRLGRIRHIFIERRRRWLIPGEFPFRVQEHRCR